MRRGQRSRGPLLRRVRGDRRRGVDAGRRPAERGRRGSPARREAAGRGARRPTERRLVSVLFADLVGFTTLADDSDPEAVREFLGRYFDARPRGRRAVRRRRSRSSSATRSWPSGARRPSARTTPSGRSVRRWTSSRPCRPSRADRPQARAAVLTGRGRRRRRGAGPGDGGRRPRQHRLAAPGGRAAGHRPRRRGDPARGGRRDRLRGRRRAAPARQGGARARVARRPRRRRPPRGGAQQPRRAAVRGPGRGAPAPPGPPARHDARRACPPRLGRRDRRHREEPPRLGAGEVRRRRGRRHLLAPRPLPGVRRGARVLGARRDGPRAGPDRRERRRRDVAREARADARASTSRTPSERAWMEPRLAALLGLEAAPPGEREEFEAACRTLFERISERGTVVLVFEELQWADPALLDFIEIDHRSLAGPADPRRHALAARPARAPADVGRGPAQLLEPPARPPGARRGGDAPRGPCPGPARRRPSRRSSSALGGDPAVRGRDGPDAPRPGRRCASATAATTSTASWARWRSRRRWPRCSARGSTASRSPSGCSSATRRCSATRSPFDALAAATGHSAGAPRAHARRARPQGDPRPRGGPALTRARPVPLRPGPHPRGRLRAAGEARPAGPPPGRRALLRGARRPGAGRASSRRTTWRPTGSRPRARSATRSRPRRGRRSSTRRRARATCTPTRASSASWSRPLPSRPIPADEREILARLAGAAFDAAKELAEFDRAEGYARRALERHAGRRRPGRHRPGLHDAGEHPRLQQPRQGGPGHPPPGRRRARRPGARRRDGAPGGRARSRLPDVGRAGARPARDRAGARARRGSRPAGVDRRAAGQPGLGGDRRRAPDGGARAPARGRPVLRRARLPERADALRDEPLGLRDGGQPAAVHGRRVGGPRDRPSPPARRLGGRGWPATGPKVPSRSGSGTRSWPSPPSSRPRACCPPTRAPASSSASTWSAPTAARSTRRRMSSTASSRRCWTTSRSPARYHDAFAHLRFAAGDYEGDAAAGHRAVRRRARGSPTTSSRRPARRSGCATPPACVEALGERDVSDGPRDRPAVRGAPGRPGRARGRGRTRPGPGYLAAEAGLRDLGIRFELGLAALEHAVFLPDEPSARGSRRRGARDLRRAGCDDAPGAASGRGSRRRLTPPLPTAADPTEDRPDGPIAARIIGPWPAVAATVSLSA